MFGRRYIEFLITRLEDARALESLPLLTAHFDQSGTPQAREALSSARSGIKDFNDVNFDEALREFLTTRDVTVVTNRLSEVKMERKSALKAINDMRDYVSHKDKPSEVFDESTKAEELFDELYYLLKDLPAEVDRAYIEALED